MKKYLSLMLVLMMLAVTALPVVYAESSDEPGLLPYKLETFKRFRNGVTYGDAVNNSKVLTRTVSVLPYRFPLFGDSAVVGVHTNMGASFYEGTDSNTDNIGIIGETPSSGGSLKTERALKVKASATTETAAVSAGFIPNEVLYNATGIEFTWSERAVTLGTDAKILLQWVGSNGLAITNGTIATIAHNATLSSSAYADVSLYVTDGGYKYNGGAFTELTDFILADIPDDAVGIKIVIGAVGGERYYKQFGVNVASYNMASLAGDLMFFDENATSVTVKFSSPVTENASEVKLYDSNNAVVTTTPSWNGDNTELTLSLGAAFGANGSFRISTSKAGTDYGDIFNDIRFSTKLRTEKANGSTMNAGINGETLVAENIKIFDTKGNEYALDCTVTEDADETVADDNTAGTINITATVTGTADPYPTAIVPVINLVTNPDAGVFYAYNLENAFSSHANLAIRNGSTAIPNRSSFVIVVGSNSTASNRKVYEVNFEIEEQRPSVVTSTVSPADENDDLANLGYDASVKVEFSHKIGEEDCITIKEDGTLLDVANYTVTWTSDKKSATIAPTNVWVPGAEYQILVEEFASIYGDQVSVTTPAEGLIFNVEDIAEITANIAPADDSENLAELDYFAAVKVTFDYAIADEDSITIEKDGTLFNASYYTVEWAADKKTAVIAPVDVWAPEASYEVKVAEDASIFGENVSVTATGLEFAVKELSEVIATITSENESESLTELGHITPVKVSFNYAIENTDCITMEKEGTLLDSANYTVEWAADKKSAVIAPATNWELGGNYEVKVSPNASVFGKYGINIADADLTFTVTSTIPVAEIVSAEVNFNAAGKTFTDNFDPAGKKITLVSNVEDDITFDSVTVNLTLGNSVSFIKANAPHIPADIHPAAGETEVSIMGLDLSAAVGVENAINIIVDNGLGNTETYKIYCVEYTSPLVTEDVYDEEDFDDATPGAEWLGKTNSFIANAGYSGLNNGVGKWKPSSNTAPEGHTAYANIQEVDGSKALYITSTNVYAGFATKDIPKSVYEDSYKVKFSFDMKSVPGAGQNAVGSDSRIWIFGDFDLMQNLNDEHGIFLYEYNGIQHQLNNTASTEVPMTKLVNAWEANKWYNVEFILEKTYIPDNDPRKIAGTVGDYGTVLQVRMKERGTENWLSNTKTIILKWNYTESETLALLWNREKSAAYFDNFKFTSYEMDNKPTVTLQNGTYISADNGYFDVIFKAPVSIDDIENTLYVTDAEGNRVDCTYDFASDMKSVRIYPEIGENNKVYKVIIDGLIDATGAVLDETFDIPVGPVDVLPYSTTAEYDIFADNYSQTLDIYYRYVGEGGPSMNVTFTYGEGTTLTSNSISVRRPSEGDAFAIAKITIPEEVVANSAGKIKITVNCVADITIAGIKVEENFDLDAINNATEETAAEAILSMVELVGRATNYYYLADSLKDGLEVSLLEKLANEGPFADTTSAVTWIMATLDQAVADNIGADTSAKIISADVVIPGADKPYEDTFDSENKAITILYAQGDVIDFSAVTVNINLGNPVTYLKSPQEIYPAARETEISVTLNLTGALGEENAVSLVLDNGMGGETVYKVYYKTYTPPVVNELVYGMEDFESANAGDAWLGKTESLVANAGYSGLNNGVGKWKPSSNEESGYAEIVEESGNKVLYVTSGNVYAGFATKDIPKSVYEDSYKVVFSFDMKSVPGEGQLTVGQDGRLWIPGNFDSMKQDNDDYGIHLYEYNRIQYSLASGSLDVGLTPISEAWEANKWYNVEFILEKTLIPDDDPRGISGYGTTLQIRIKEKDGSEWKVGYNNGTVINEKTKILKWNYTESETLGLLWNRVKGAAYFDNFKFTAYSMDIDTSIEYQHGTYIDSDGYFDVKFKSPVSKEDIANRLFVVDNNGEIVTSTYEFLDEFKTVRVHPEIADGNGNKIYTVKSSGLVDLSGIEMIVNFDVPVGPTNVFDYDTSAEYDILANDYSQTLNVYYNFEGDDSTSFNVTFLYGDGLTATASSGSVSNPVAGTTFGVAKITIPADVVENSGGKVRITVNGRTPITIGGVAVEEQFNLEAVNAATESTVSDAVVSMVKLVNGTASYNVLGDSVKEDIDSALLEQLETSAFADKAAVITWITGVLEDSTESNPNPNVPVPGDPDTGDEGEGDGDGDGDGGSFPGPGTVAGPVISYPQFGDLGQASWATAAINALYLAGIVDGITPTEFAPLQKVTREQFVKLIVVAFDMYNPFAVSSFGDVTKGAWYESYVASAYNAGIINGVTAGEFGVGQELTREQMASILKRACDKAGIKLEGYNTATFSDSETISAYAADDVKALVKAGIINGIDGTFSPKVTANRAMAAQVIYLAYTLKK